MGHLRPPPLTPGTLRSYPLNQWDSVGPPLMMVLGNWQLWCWCWCWGLGWCWCLRWHWGWCWFWCWCWWSATPGFTWWWWPDCPSIGVGDDVTAESAVLMLVLSSVVVLVVSDPMVHLVVVEPDLVVVARLSRSPALLPAVRRGDTALIIKREWFSASWSRAPRAVGAAHPAGKHFNTQHLGIFENQQHWYSTTKTITNSHPQNDDYLQQMTPTSWYVLVYCNRQKSSTKRRRSTTPTPPWKEPAWKSPSQRTGALAKSRKQATQQGEKLMA